MKLVLSILIIILSFSSFAEVLKEDVSKDFCFEVADQKKEMAKTFEDISNISDLLFYKADILARGSNRVLKDLEQYFDDMGDKLPTSSEFSDAYMELDRLAGIFLTTAHYAFNYFRTLENIEYGQFLFLLRKYGNTSLVEIDSLIQKDSGLQGYEGYVTKTMKGAQSYLESIETLESFICVKKEDK